MQLVQSVLILNNNFNKDNPYFIFALDHSSSNYPIDDKFLKLIQIFHSVHYMLTLSH